MIGFVALIFGLLCVGGAAEAALSRATLADVSVSPPPDARLDPGLPVRDSLGRSASIGDFLGGRPAFVTFVDYTCSSLCGSDLRLIAAAIEAARLDSTAYRLLVIGIDPKDTNTAAETMATNEIPPAVRPASVLLLPDKRVVDRLTRALGFRFAYDPALDQFAHPSAVYAVNRKGDVTALLSPFALDPTTLASVLAMPTPKSPTLGARIRILCYGLDAATGVYTGQIMNLLKTMAVLIVVLLVAGIGTLLWRRRGTP